MPIYSRRFATLIRWVSLSGQVAGMQTMVQGLNAITGLLIVRNLPKEQYALFTISASMLATLNLLADGGVSTGLTAIGGRIYNQPGMFARLLLDCRHISRKLTILGFLLAAPLFYGLYANVKASVPVAFAAIGMAGLAAWPSATTTLFNVANRLHSKIHLIQGVEMFGAFMRFIFTAIVIFSGWITMLPALGATVVSLLFQSVMIRGKSVCLLHSPSPEANYRPELGGFVRSLYANQIFFCVHAQIATWIIGWFAGASEVASLGALSRLAVLFSVLMAPVHYLVVPAIARTQDAVVLRRRFAGTFIMVCSIFIPVLLLAVWWPDPFLKLLGSAYSGLTIELPLALSAQAVSLVSALAWNLILAKGWVRHAWIVIVTSLLGLAIGAAVYPLNTVRGMLSFGIVSTFPTLLFSLVVIILSLSKKSAGKRLSHE